jgi:uncharacterized protein (TIGR02246 family)
LALLSTAALLGCAASPRPADFELQPEQVAKRETGAALQSYVQALRQQDAAQIARLFVPNGTMEHTGQAAIAGRQQIQAFLESFSGYKVLSHDMTVLAVSPATTHVSQSGRYVQRVRTPGGDEVTVRGWFIVQWQRQADGGWLIERVNTSSGPLP